MRSTLPLQNILATLPQATLPSSSEETLSTRHTRRLRQYGYTLSRALDQTIHWPQTQFKDRYNQPIKSFQDLLPDFMHRFDGPTRDAILLLFATLLHRAPFENISRLWDTTPLRAGHRFWPAMAAGLGGTCAEKSMALKFLCDALKIPTHHVLCHRYPLPDDYKQQVLRWTPDSNHPPPPHIEHHILLCHTSENIWLVDTTGGNMPLMFLNQKEAEPYFKQGIFARMAYRNEEFNLTKVDDETGDRIFILSEDFTFDGRLDLIWKQKLGLIITPQYHIGSFLDWGGEQSAIWQSYYSRLAQQATLPPPYFIPHHHLDQYSRRNPNPVIRLLPSLRQRLLFEYDQPDYTGDITFFIQSFTTQPIQNSHHTINQYNGFWQQPRIGAARPFYQKILKRNMLRPRIEPW
ncbi:hypothetical protein ACQZV8_17675 [Magnetococcales bacterium HHB-1]